MGLTELDFAKFTLYIAATNQFSLHRDLSIMPSNPTVDLASTTYWIEFEDILSDSLQAYLKPGVNVLLAPNDLNSVALL